MLLTCVKAATDSDKQGQHSSVPTALSALSDQIPRYIEDTLDARGKWTSTHVVNGPAHTWYMYLYTSME